MKKKQYTIKIKLTEEEYVKAESLIFSHDAPVAGIAKKLLLAEAAKNE